VTDENKGAQDPSPAGTDDEASAYPDVFAQLEKNEAEWQRLERSAAGEALKAAFVAARPFLVPIAQEAGKQGVALLFGQLAERIANK
jgi:hypothetical protein